MFAVLEDEEHAVPLPPHHHLLQRHDVRVTEAAEELDLTEGRDGESWANNKGGPAERERVNGVEGEMQDAQMHSLGVRERGGGETGWGVGGDR